MSNTNKPLTAEEILKSEIDSFYKDVPRGFRTDFQMLPDDPKRLVAIQAMHKYAAQQTAALREELEAVKKERGGLKAKYDKACEERDNSDGWATEMTRERDEAVKNTVELCRKAFAAGMDLEESGGRGEDWKGFYNRELSRLSSVKIKDIKEKE